MHTTEPDRAGDTTTPATPAAPRARTAVTPRPLDVAAGWSWRLLVVGAAVAVVFLVLSRLRIIVLPAIVALLATAILYPPLRWLRARGWPRLLATWTVLLGAITTVAAVVASLSWQVAGEVDQLDVSIEEGVADVEDWLVDGPLGLSRSSVTEAYGQAREWVTSGDGLLSTGIAGQAVVAVEVVAGLLLALVLVFLKDGERMWQAITGRLGTRASAHVDHAGRRAWTTLGGFVRGTAIVAAVDAVLIGTAVAVLGVPFALPLAALTFAGAFLPIVGAVVAGAIAVLVALATQGVVTALILLGVVVLVQQVEGGVLQPIVLGRAVSLHPVVILLAVAGGAALGGIVGAFLAVPVVAVASAVMGYVWGEVGPRDATAP
ncbi:AI-2E family transporter [Miltoncostaea oceani]|uniref:AI-2E family transporter n=1 Tax=Miltoncostaea oceani TaxID=2843216 RepID=UPI001C3CB875|nr:AI-2E family transporter [Miltoncostaea oceani]